MQTLHVIYEVAWAYAAPHPIRLIPSFQPNQLSATSSVNPMNQSYSIRAGSVRISSRLLIFDSRSYGLVLLMLHMNISCKSCHFFQ